MIGDFEGHGADDEAVADGECVTGNTVDHQVLAEGARREWGAEVFGPEIVVGLQVDIDGLVGSTVVLAVEYGVAEDPERINEHWAAAGRLHDASGAGAAGEDGRRADIDRKQTGHQCSRVAKKRAVARRPSASGP